MVVVKMNSEAQKPIFPEKIGDISLESNLTQNLEIPLEFKDRDFKIYVDYRFSKGENKDERTLRIEIPHIPTPTSIGSGVYATFTDDSLSGLQFGAVKGSNDYYHNKKVADFFTEHIQPILNERLPEYMKELIKIN